MLNPIRTVQEFLNDFKVHFIYTLFIVLIASGATYFLINNKIEQKFSSLTNQITNQAPPPGTVFIPPSQGNAYIERGSPYDNRTIDSATPSANVIFHGPRDKKKIAITFDAEMTDGMKADLVSGKTKSSYDKRITDTLIQTQTKATLFLTGLWIELYPDVTRDLSNNPLFELASHSYTDSSYYGFCYGLQQLPNTVKVEDIGATEKLLRTHAGIDNRFFRFPGGCYTPADVKLVNEANDTVVHWDVSGNDGFNVNTQQVIHNVVDNTQNGSIIILHLNGAPNSPKTADALPAIISSLKAKGFEFVKVSELLGVQPPAKVANK
jgi:peptidoglycan/xylan/chitin deacetylase (PgdA/CDA1 family)